MIEDAFNVVKDIDAVVGESASLSSRRRKNASRHISSLETIDHMQIGHIDFTILSLLQALLLLFSSQTKEIIILFITFYIETIEGATSTHHPHTINSLIIPQNTKEMGYKSYLIFTFSFYS